MATTVMKPLSVAPDQAWYGNDGFWSTFLFGYGNPRQYVHALVSTSIPQPYVVLQQGCTPQDASDCASARGIIFYPNASSSWQDLGIFTLEFEENLEIYQNGQFAFDSISLGMPGSSEPTIDRQIIVGIATKDFFIGSLGLRPAPTNLTTFNNPIPSLLQSLKYAGSIPSLSWAYTAGAYYQSQTSKSGEGSLTLGGYDASRFQDSNITFYFSPDTSRSLELAIRTIETAEGSISLLSDPILSFIDSAVSHIWLPLEACQKFEQTFNLTYDENLSLYLVNDHDALVAQNATITFTLSNDLTLDPSDTIVTIKIPYSAFDLQLTSDYPNNTNNATYYFPIRQAANSSQYTLGRAFLQETYLIADYEREEFSVHQVLFPDAGSSQQDLRTIQPLNSNSSNTTTSNVGNSSGTALSTSALVGIIVSGVVAFLALSIGGYLAYRKFKRSQPSLQIQEKEPPPIPEILSKEEKQELHGINTPLPELGAVETTRELEAPRDERWISEMPG